MGDLELILARLSRVYRTGRPLALLFDYDGTLAPIRPMPAEAILPDSARRALRRLTNADNIGVGILSGRSLADLRQMVGMSGLYYAGTSGLEIDLLGRILVPAALEVARAPLDQIAGRLTDVAVRYPGAWVELKPFGLTLHYRAVAPRWICRLRHDADEALCPWARRLRVENVTLGLEVVPDVGWDKGTAVREIVADMGRESFPVYVGDSANDVAALVAVEAMGGMSIAVGTEARRSDAWLPGPGVVGSLVILLANILHGARDQFLIAQ